MAFVYTVAGGCAVALLVGLTRLAYTRPDHYRALMVGPLLLSLIACFGSVIAFAAFYFVVAQIEPVLADTDRQAFYAVTERILTPPLYVCLGGLFVWVYFGGLMYLHKLLDGAEEQAAGKTDSDAASNGVVLIGKPDERG